MKKPIGLGKIQSLPLTLILLFSALNVLSQGTEPFSLDRSPLPAPTGFVNDYAGVIDAATKTQLEARLKAFKETSNPPVELAVAVVRTTNDRPIFEYSLAVARGWKIGSKLDDNPSALLFVAIDDRKYFTQVSKDLEDELPDGIAGNLQRQYLVPEFREGNYAKGIADTIDAYIRTIEQRRSGVEQPSPTPGPEFEGMGVSQTLYSLFCCLVVILVIVLIIWSNRGGGKSGKDRDRWGGGGFGGGAAGALPWIILGGSGGSGGSSSDWGGSSGGSDWGGFGGGGDFGGGGAGGDW